ncbi:DUF493 family protein [Capnocytophaga sp.]|uniref:DUF493 family protein n=1 Tax=Capnocytophaga sp. TaxID=44737 RepID=UPI0026DBE5E3|nr:DUF493 family protein [Capnocytophaga sp.]MDO5105121.1 DUF493 family protein [Capnocytophaga sp.]
MKTEQELNDFFERLKKELEETTSFPTSYLYKFIVPATDENIKTIRNIFKETDAEIKTRPSSAGKYTGVSVTVTLPNPDAVIHYYREVGKIEGILSL